MTVEIGNGAASFGKVESARGNGDAIGIALGNLLPTYGASGRMRKFDRRAKAE